MTASPSQPEYRGLSPAEAAERLAADGPNELSSGKQRSIFGIIGGVLREPMLMFLVAAGIIYLLLGEPSDALILLAFAGLTVVIAVVQEARTERAIDALRDLSVPHAMVIRNGQRQTIRSQDVVRGDLLVVSEGGRVAADGWLVQADTLQADEAILTGESVAVTKAHLSGEEPAEPPLPGGDGVPYAYSGTLIVRGTGLIRVAATGPRTRIGAIGQSLATLTDETPRLTLQTRSLVRWFAVGGIGVSVLAILLYGFLRGSWLDALLSGVALAMSMLPEELPVVLTLFMTMGALRMSRSRVLARRGTAIETLGAATVLCTDKTGTLTQNRMVVEELRLPDGAAFRSADDGVVFPEEFLDLARAGILACPEDPFDPMEKAFHELDAAFPGAALKDRQDDGWTLHRHYPLDTDLLAMSHVWSSQGEDGKMVAAKGAPEAIASLCHLDEAARQEMDASVAEMASRGLRVLGVARSCWENGTLPDNQHDFDFTFAGLVGLADPIRETVPEAVRTLQSAGLRVVMITGDYPATARAIAEKAGIAPGETMSGEDISRLSDEELASRIHAVSVFARVMPEQKLRIVTALKAAGEVVAMTGDGVNDAPSLKAAHIGVAMGQRGTDVAREASAIVLLDDDFQSIATAVRLGRRIYDNIRKATEFIFAVHIPIGGLALTPLLTGWPIILGPIHIALLELVIDPMCSLAFEAEPEEPDIMDRPPRAPDSPLVSRVLLGWSALQGIVALIGLIALAGWAQFTSMDDAHFRSTCFAGLICAVLVLIIVNRSFRSGISMHRSGHNLTFAVIMACITVIYALLFLVQPVADLFHFAVLKGDGIAEVAAMTVVMAVILTLAKRRFAKAIVG
ncbi:cation-translocating P-type ATPase [Novosphingobium album (ex Hu et al. 2023)]|uniref:Cation-translocating P-type ATPase n=1 Tax=Novosphingobium album (ex Hu et al. 2023) TaxID=2930093 RepID=A0ABT0B1Y0_9SPHN|nr:cation-translocating P-type ATPase [Novosphingobium album (ex Hu et al. 2023)]MCJ2179063.1 cation-translocating P-type ATPase [Novosphingobium album (ex Hu et al. 2023)]